MEMQREGILEALGYLIVEVDRRAQASRALLEVLENLRDEISSDPQVGLEEYKKIVLSLGDWIMK